MKVIYDLLFLVVVVFVVSSSANQPEAPTSTSTGTTTATNTNTQNDKIKAMIKDTLKKLYEYIKLLRKNTGMVVIDFTEVVQEFERHFTALNEQNISPAKVKKTFSILDFTTKEFKTSAEIVLNDLDWTANWIDLISTIILDGQVKEQLNQVKGHLINSKNLIQNSYNQVISAETNTNDLFERYSVSHELTKTMFRNFRNRYTEITDQITNQLNQIIPGNILEVVDQVYEGSRNLYLNFVLTAE